MVNTKVAREASGGRPLKPYVAIVACVIVASVVAFALIERWVADPVRGVDAPVGDPEGGRVVIGGPERVPSKPATPEPISPPSGASYKPEEFTFYKSLGNPSTPEPALAPSLPPAPPPQAASPKTEPVRKAVSKSYTVQVGSFQDRRAADRLAARVRRYRHTVSVHRVVLPDAGVRYRVRLGSFRTRQDALTLAETLKKRERLEPFVALVGAGATGP